MIVIVPDLPPKINGLGDHAFLLAEKLQQLYGIQTKFIVAGNPSYPLQQLKGFPVYTLPALNKHELLKAIRQYKNETIIHLHYVGYGYQQRGIPFWLIAALQKIKASPGMKLLVTFHELFAGSTKFWQSSFWLSRWQKNICKKIFGLCDAAITTRKGFAEILRGFYDKPVTVCNVFSNVFETKEPTPLSERKKQLVIFSATNIHHSLKNFCAEINHSCDRLGINHIILAGNFKETLPELNRPVSIAEGLSNADIATLLSESYASFIGFPSPLWFGKSGVFAAACAHGCLPVSAYHTTAEDGLVTGTHFLPASSPENTLSLQQIAANAHAWYMKHNIDVQAVFIRDITDQLTEEDKS